MSFRDFKPKRKWLAELLLVIKSNKNSEVWNIFTVSQPFRNVSPLEVFYFQVQTKNKIKLKKS
uniref:Uncharacterized protein n=1 Tax=Octopus bimaculoides TaxID=37653 RepID=A0A0L8GIH5_OCTBM